MRVRMKSFRPAAPASLRFFVFVAFLALIALSGGAARFDEPAQAVARIVSLIYLGWLSWTLSAPDVRRMTLPLAILAAIAAVAARQLVPLPPAIWTALPGREVYAGAAEASGMPQPWRPINLVPDRGWNVLYGLIPPLAATLGIAGMNSAERGRLLPAFLALCAISLLVAASQLTGGGVIGWYGSSWDYNASGFFTNRNHQALLIAIAIPAYALWTAELRIGGREQVSAPVRAAFFLAGFAGLLTMLVATGSRAGLALGAVGTAAAALLTATQMRGALIRWRRRTRRLMLGLGALVVVLLGGLLFLLRDSEAIQRLFALDARADPRVRAWEGATTMAADLFPFGTGMGAFEPVFRHYEPITGLTYRSMNQVHSEPLAAVVEMGLPGLLLVFVILLAWGWAARRAWSPAGSSLQRLGVVALLLVGLANCVDYSIRTPLMAVLCAVFAGWAAPRTRRRSAVPDAFYTAGRDRHGFTVKG